MSQKSKQEWLDAIAPRYRRALKAEKTKILDEFCAVAGYERKYAIRLLSGWTRRKAPARARARRGRPPRYGAREVEVLKKIWRAGEQPCSKRLKAMLPAWLPFYEKRYGRLEASVRERVLTISAATIDRLLKPARARSRKGRCSTRPATLLKTQIPIRSEPWDVDGPGWFEADTVAHCGESMAGQFVYSLTFTDIWSGWTEMRAVWNKGSRDVVARICEIENGLAFAVLGFDSDNGSEFLNHHLYRYFADRREPVKFTRSRPYRKNDNAHVEQKQWTHVRQLLGYERLEDRRLVDPINALYAGPWSKLHNFFMPSMKLSAKQKVGSKYQRRYSKPLTPYQRLLESDHLSEEAKKGLREQYERLDPFALQAQVEKGLKIVRAVRMAQGSTPTLRPDTEATSLGVF